MSINRYSPYNENGRRIFRTQQQWWEKGFVLRPDAKVQCTTGYPLYLDLYASESVVLSIKKAEKLFTRWQVERVKRRKECEKLRRAKVRKWKDDNKDSWRVLINQHPIIVITIDTTGFDYRQDEITNIAYKVIKHKYDNEFEIINREFNDFSNKEATEKFLNQFRRDANEVGSVIIAHNVYFVMSFINKLLDKFNMRWPSASYICTMKQAEKMYCGGRFTKFYRWPSLAYLASQVNKNIEVDENNAKTRVDALTKVIMKARQTGFINFMKPELSIEAFA